MGDSKGLALAGSMPDLELACGLGTGAMFSADVSSRTWVPVGGLLPVPVTAPEPDLARQVRADAALTSFWSDRLRRVAALL